MTTQPTKANIDDLVQVLTPKLKTPQFKLLSGRGLAWIAVRSCWRYFITGRELTGQPRDNATFLHRATVDYRGKPKEKLTGPKWQRLTRRWVGIGIPMLLLIFGAIAWMTAAAYSFLGFTAPGWTQINYALVALLYVLIGSLVIIGTFGWHLKKALPNRAAKKEFAVPTAEVIANTMGVKATKRELANMVQLPDGYDRKEVTEPVRVKLPTGRAIDEGTKKRLASQAAAKLGMRNPSVEWQLTGSEPCMVIKPNPGPPLTVEWEDVRAHVEKASHAKPVIGLASGGRPVYLDYDNDSPHLFASGGPGTGKSTLFRFLMMQRIRNGSGLVVLDFKGISHRWADKLPSNLVRYAYRIEDIHELLVALNAEMMRRIEIARADENAQFRTIDILVEESNSLLKVLNTWWAENREPGDPKSSPAVDALGFLIYMGRELKLHAHYAAQRASADAFGGSGGDRRESFQIRLLAKWTKATWKMLCDGVPYLAFPGGNRGMWAVVVGDQVDLVRVPRIDDATAVAWASECSDPTPMFSDDAPLRSGGAPVIDGAVAERKPVTLRESIELLPGTPLALSTLESLRKQDPEFPESVGARGAAKLYDPEQLAEWKRMRDAKKQAAIGNDAELKGRIYGINTLIVDETGLPTGGTELGYVGKTRRTLAERGDEHRGRGQYPAEQPWSDIIVGDPFLIWEGGCDDATLIEAEMTAIAERKPRYNYEGQEGAKHATSKPLAAEQRELRDARRAATPTP